MTLQTVSRIPKAHFGKIHGSVKSGDLMRLYGISRQAAGKELKQGVGPGLIREEGKVCATRYVTA